ncbi:mCG148447 [Mus musculus]|nr:mCG148447 [Mus musculus]
MQAWEASGIFTRPSRRLLEKSRICCFECLPQRSHASFWGIILGCRLPWK